MINTSIKPKFLIILIQAYATTSQAANGDLESSTQSMKMFQYIRNRFSKSEMVEFHTWMEGIEKTNKVQMTTAMELMGLKSALEPLIKVVTH